MTIKYFLHKKGGSFSTPMWALVSEDTYILSIFYDGKQFGTFDGNTVNTRRGFRIIQIL